MKLQKHLYVGGRQPGDLILEALRKAVESDCCQRRWVVTVDEAHMVSVVVAREKRGKSVIAQGVNLRVLKPINPDDLFGVIVVELSVTGLMKLVAARQILADFEVIERAFKQFFVDRPKVYRKFDHQDVHDSQVASI